LFTARNQRIDAEGIPMPRSRILVSVAIVLTACGQATATLEQEPEPSPPATPPTSPTSGASPSSTPEPEPAERVEVADDGRSLLILCDGEGSPTIVFEDGHPSETGGIARFSTGPLWDALAAETRVCAYDRAGYGASDPAPMEPRTADDVVDDLQHLLAAAGEEGPFLLVGSSFGGMIVTHYAAREPGEVAGVVLLDVPAPTDTLTLDEIPELAWDHPANPEHVDVIPEFETRFARDPVSMEAPLLILTAAGGQSNLDDQSYWLQVSPDADQVLLEGGHDLDFDNPEGVIAEILGAVEDTR
jgi:pimeloyl-ACP methyl ester carboxylesterase